MVFDYFGGNVETLKANQGRNSAATAPPPILMGE